MNLLYINGIVYIRIEVLGLNTYGRGAVWRLLAYPVAMDLEERYGGANERYTFNLMNTVFVHDPWEAT